MKRSWSTILLIGGLAVLLLLLGGLQYRWLRQISESEGEKARKRVQEQTDRFAKDFDREIQGSYFNFQTDSESWKKKDWTSFNERYDFWREKTSYPGLISDFYFFEAKSDALPLRYETVNRSFQPVEITADLAALRARFSDDKTFEAVYEDSFTLVLPVHEADRKVVHKGANIVLKTRSHVGPVSMDIPEKAGFLVIQLDPATIKDKILPDLTTKYFGDGEFRTAVVNKAGQTVFQSIAGDKSDATAPLFGLSPDNFIFYNKDLMSSISGERHRSGEERKSDVILNSHIESRTFNRVKSTGDNDGSMKIEVTQETTPRTAVFTTSVLNSPVESPWTLQVQHVSGSLDSFLANTLRRNLAIGFGLLLLLAGAIGAIIISTQRAKRLAQRQIDFVSSVSHEFRTPLAVIYSAGENLADGVAKEDGQVSRYGDLIKGEGRKLSGMVEQILEFAGANSGRQKYKFGDVAVGDVVEDAVAECRPLIDEKHIELELNISDNLPTISANKRALSQAIQNLIANSVKYNNGSAWMRVSAENGSGKVKITVEDCGIGISKSDLRQIFEPFYRSKQVVDAQIHGNGLGLSLVKQITEAHGGRVNASSEVGKGSKFTIELPPN